MTSKSVAYLCFNYFMQRQDDCDDALSRSTYYF